MALKKWVKSSFIMGMSLTVLMPHLAFAHGEETIRSYVARDAVVPLIKPSWGQFVLHTESLNKLYTLRNHSAIWVDSNGHPNAMAETLKNYLLTAGRHGLEVSDYWDENVEMLYKAAQANPKNWITFELAASEAMIRYAQHLSNGRFDPQAIDVDIKFAAKTFSAYNQLDAAVSYGATSLASNLEAFAPRHPRYRDLMDILASYKKGNGSWTEIQSPSVALKLNVKDPTVVQIRERLRVLGYVISSTGGDLFDAEFDTVIRKFQKANGLTVDGIIGTKNSEVLRALNSSPAQRISQIAVNMEKLRWIPQDVETRHVFVNLATTEFFAYDEGGEVFHFNTVNGSPVRRTPLMKDSIRFVNLNPYWTVPRSIAIKDKLPLLMKDMEYLARNGYELVDERTDKVVLPYLLDWRNINSKNFPYYIRQLPGVNNALGVVKFPLTNPWAIYLHDTNDKDLLKESRRHRSSGCVRLEYPLEFAAYLLQDQPEWNMNAISNFVPTRGQRTVERERWDKSVHLKKPMPVYLMYQTVEKDKDGGVRFINDVYGLDLRIKKAIANKKAQGELF